MDLEGMDEMKFVSINSEYLIVSNANKDCIKIPMDLDSLIQLISQAGNAITVANIRKEQAVQPKLCSCANKSKKS